MEKGQTPLNQKAEYIGLLPYSLPPFPPCMISHPLKISN